MNIRKHTDLLVIHCSATQAKQDIGLKEITEWHVLPSPRGHGWAAVGYHFIIRRSGAVEHGRAVNLVGAHVERYNHNSIGICLVGGIDAHAHPENNFTPDQFAALSGLLKQLRQDYPRTRIVGHRDLSPDKNGDGIIEPGEWLKACPSFDVAAWLALVGISQSGVA